MVEILEPPPPWSHEETCKGCKAKLKVVMSDLRYAEFGGCYDERGEYKIYFTCPVCHICCTLSESKLPEHVKNDARSRRDR